MSQYHRYAKWLQPLQQLLNGAAKWIGYWVCRALPIDWVSHIGSKMGRYGPKAEQSYQDRLVKNLTLLGVGPSSLATSLSSIRRESGRAYLEMLIADRIVRGQRIRWAPCPELLKALHDQRPIVFCSIHLSNLGDVTGAEIIRFVSSHAPGYRFGYSARTIHDSVERKIVERSRNHYIGDAQAWVMGPTGGLARRLMAELARPPSCILLHIDESRHHQVHCPSFGRVLPDRINLSYAVKLAIKSRSCIVPLYIVRDGSKRVGFTMQVIRLIDCATHQQNSHNITRIIDADFEQVIRFHPDKWLQCYHARLGS